MSEYIRNLERTQFVVEDMLTDLYTKINSSARWLHRRSGHKRFNDPLRHASAIAAGPDLRSTLIDQPHAGETGLIFEEDKRKIEEITNTVGNLAISMHSPVYNPFMDRRYLTYEGGNISPRDFTVNVWAPEYAAAMTTAMHFGQEVEVVSE